VNAQHDTVLPEPVTPEAVTPEAVTPEEYARRLAAVRERMASRSLAALFVGDPANIYYLTGYNAWSFYTPQVLLVPAEGDVHFFTRAMDAQGAHRTAHLAPHQIHGYPEPLVHRPDVHPFDWVADRIRELGLVTGSADVAMELDAHFTSPRAYLALRDGLPEWSISDSRELVNWVRLVKSDTEIALMRGAAAVATEAGEWTFTEQNGMPVIYSYGATQLGAFATDATVTCPDAEDGPCTEGKLNPINSGPFPPVPTCVPALPNYNNCSAPAPPATPTLTP